MENEILQIISKHKKKFSSLSDFYFFPDIPEKRNLKAIKSHSLEYGHKILFHSFGSLLGFTYGSSLFTKDFFYLKTDGAYLKIYWKDLEKVIYHNKNFQFILDSENNQKNIFKEEDVLPSFDRKPENCIEFATILTGISELFVNEEQKDFKEVNECFIKNDFSAVIKESEKFIENHGEEGFYSHKIHLLSAKSFLLTGEVERAAHEILFCEENIGDEDPANYDSGLEIAELKGDILLQQNMEYEALHSYRRALDNSEDKAKINELKKKSKSANQLLQTNFLNKPYQNRKLILIDDKQVDLSSKHFKVLLKNNLPTLKFPVGHPVDKELYVGHPYNADVYIPLSTFEENIFMDRFQEFSYFLQSLGATKISIVNKRGAEIVEEAEISGKSSFKLDTLIGDSKTSNEYSNKHETQSQNFKQISRTQTFSPVKQPFLPENLVWYLHETSWQRLYEQRIHGNILNHSEVISTEQNQVITKNEKRSIQQSLEYYFNEADATHSIDADHMFREKETTEWIINVEFAPIESLGFTGNHHDSGKLHQESLDSVQENLVVTQASKDDQFSQEELDYLKRVEALVGETGIIEDEDRRILDRIKVKFKVNAERALYIENQISEKFLPSFSEVELRYIDEIKFYLEDDGEITPKERIMLEQEREDLEIAVQRGAEIEALIINQYNLTTKN